MIKVNKDLKEYQCMPMVFVMPSVVLSLVCWF